MFPRPRNPSPPDDDFDFRNMCIMFLKPSHSVQPLKIDIGIFHKNLFISPPVSGDERQASRNKVTDPNYESSRNKVTDANLESHRNKVTDANCKVLAPSCSINERRTSEPMLSTLSGKKQTCHAESEDISTRESRREKRYKLPKKKASYEDSDSDTLSKLSVRFDHLKSRLETEQNLHADENASVHGAQCVKPRNLKLLPDKEIYIPKNVLKSQKRAKHDGASQVNSSSLEHEKASKKKKRVSKHKIAVKSEPISDVDRKRHRKSSKRKNKKLAHSDESDSDGLEASKSRKHRRSSQSYKNISESEDSDYYAADSRKTSQINSPRMQLKNYREYDYSDAELNSRSARREGSKKYTKECSPDSDKSNTRMKSREDKYLRMIKECYLSDSDRSNSRGSSEPDRRYQYSNRNEYDAPDSDKSNTRRKSREDKYRRMKNEPVDDTPDSDNSNTRRKSREDKYLRMKNEPVDDTPDSDRSNTRRKSREDKYLRMKNEPLDVFDLAESKYNPGLKANQDWEVPAFFGPDNFYCKVCQLSLNSESTYDSHMNGKKHKKAVSALSLPEIVKGSLNCLAQSREGLRPPGFRNIKQVVINAVAVLQSIADNHMENPVPGLQFVKEIHNGNEISYYCELCEAPCMSVSIMPHLLGFKHQLHCMREFFYKFYVQNKDRSKKEIEKPLLSLLYSHERQYGRGKIVVVQAVPDPKPLPSDEAGPSWRNPGCTIVTENEDKKLGILGSHKEFEVIQNDYYCKICDAHMNNRNMYAAHIVGKRHLKNEKKTNGERMALIKGCIRAPNLPSDLEKSLEHNQEDVIVGLSFIRENKTDNGPLYNCYLCGSSCTADIVDHLISLKHRIKYLETVNQNGSIPNAIPSISELEVNVYTREALVLTECEKIEKEHGRGKVEVYMSKTSTDYLARW